MQIEITSRYNGKRFPDAVSGINAMRRAFLDGVEEIPLILRVELGRMLKNVYREMELRHATKWPGGTSVTSLSRRSGRGLKSIKDSIKVKSGSSIDRVEGRIGGTGYLTIHETGGRIVAKNAKYLTIPLRAALDANGVPKKRRARDWRNTFVKKSKKGNLIIFQIQHNKLIPLYVLKKSVTIPARLNMGKAIDLISTLDMGPRIFDAVDKAFK